MVNSKKLISLVEKYEKLIYDTADHIWAHPETGYREWKTSAYMEQHFEEDISLDQAAEASGVSTFYLSRLFKQELDQTFIKILTDIRMSHAMKMVWANKYTVKEIAEKSGYANITYFYKIFKKYTGMNIGEIREYLS